MIAERMAESRDYLKRHGRRVAGKVPYGYEADPVTKQLVPNPGEARRVGLLFERAARGELPTAIAAAINKQGWPTKIYHSQRSGKVTGGGRWTARQVLTVLRNPVYIGRFADGDGSRPGCLEAIVAQDVFDAVQEILTSRRTTQEKRHRGRSFTFRQKIVCPRCGRRLSTYQITKKRSHLGWRNLLYYRCRSTSGGRPWCKGIHVAEYEMHRAMEEAMASPAAWRTFLGPGPSTRSLPTTCRPVPPSEIAVVLPGFTSTYRMPVSVFPRLRGLNQPASSRPGRTRSKVNRPASSQVADHEQSIRMPSPDSGQDRRTFLPAPGLSPILRVPSTRPHDTRRIRPSFSTLSLDRLAQPASCRTTTWYDSTSVRISSRPRNYSKFFC